VHMGAFGTTFKLWFFFFLHLVYEVPEVFLIRISFNRKI
jgi:hypothetical protein